MKQRVITGVCLMAVLVPAIIFGGIFFLGLELLISILGTYELMNTFNKKDGSLKEIKFVIPIFSAVLVFLIYFIHNNTKSFLYFDGGLKISTGSINQEYNYLMLLLGVYFIALMVIIISSMFKKNAKANYIVSSIFALTYGGILLGSAFNLEYMRGLSNQEPVFAGAVLTYVYSIVVITDTFAYLFGVKFGKHKLCPHISPKKSVEGAVSGLVFGSVFGTIIGISLQLFPSYKTIGNKNYIILIIVMFVLSILISIISQIGDLFASKIKRSYEIKDFGNILPGHGGIMDRFDSIILSGAFVYLVYVIAEFICRIQI